eukprot:Skav231024  [mRNA]  locus=scaffold1869:122323:127205:- [translate_table: standard]
MPEVIVNCLSGQQLSVDAGEDDTIDVLRQLIAKKWPEPILARNVCVPLMQSVNAKAIISLQLPVDRDWNSHSELIQTLPQDVHLVFVADHRQPSSLQLRKTSLVFRCRDCLGTGTGWTGMGRMNGSGHLRESSFQNVPNWRQEVRDVPVVLVGTKLDLCETQPPSSCVAVQEAQAAMAREIGALDYIECSALSGAGVDDIIDGAMWAFVMDAQTERDFLSNHSFEGLWRNGVIDHAGCAGRSNDHGCSAYWRKSPEHNWACTLLCRFRSIRFCLPVLA